MKTSAAPDMDQCTLISGPFGDLVQASLAVIALSALIVKRCREHPPRPWLIWTLDVAKQCFGNLYAHLLNMGLAWSLAEVTGSTDQCAWYFWNFLTDCTIGVGVCVILLRMLECWASRQPYNTWAHKIILQSGDYGNPPSCQIWTYQTLVWLGLVTAAKVALFFFLLSFAVNFDDWGRFIFYPLRHHPQAELITVMVIVPCILNIGQFWVQDNLLKKKSPPESSSLMEADLGLPPGSDLKDDPPFLMKGAALQYYPVLSSSVQTSPQRRSSLLGWKPWFAPSTQSPTVAAPSTTMATTTTLDTSVPPPAWMGPQEDQRLLRGSRSSSSSSENEV